MNALRLSLLLGLFAARASSADVLVVDATGGSAFTDIGVAIGAASTGDVILVRPGQYDPFAILSGKSLSIVAEQPGTVTIGAPSNAPPYTAMKIANLPPGRPVTLAGVRFRASTATDLVQAANAAVQLNTCLSPVVFQDCEFVGGRPCLDAWQCVGLVLERTTLSAGGGSPSNSSSSAIAGRAIRAAGATMSLHECVVLGGDGSSLHPPREAVHDLGSVVFIQNGEIRGGDGAAAMSPVGGGCANGDPGASGIVFELGALVHRLGATITGGAGGAASGPPCVAGAQGPDFQVIAGGAVAHSGTAPSVRMPTWQHESSSGTIDVTAEAGVPALLFVGSTPAFVLAQPYGGVLRIAPSSMLSISLGIVPASGTMSIPYSLPALPSGIDVATVQIQIATLGSSPVIGGSRAFHVIDSSIP